MSAISRRFLFDTTEDVFWFIGLMVGSLLACFTLFTFTLVIQHLHCIPQYPMIQQTPHIEPPHTTFFATSSVIFSTLCVLLIYSTYPICTQFECGYNILGNFYYNVILDTYIFAKLFLYFLFIGRLFNTHYQQIYKYPHWIQYFLFAVMGIVFVTTIVSNIGSFYNFHYQNLNTMIVIWIGVYTLADFILSGCTLILFFRPLWNRKTIKSTESSISVVFKYGIISALQTITAMLYGISLIVRFIFGWFHTSSPQGNSYLDICSLIQMMDMLMTMICIHLGFAKKHTYKKYCELCERYFILCCMACCSGYELALYYDEEAWSKYLLRQQGQLTVSQDHQAVTKTNPSIQQETAVNADISSTISVDCAMNVVYDAAENAEMEQKKASGMFVENYEGNDAL